MAYDPAVFPVRRPLNLPVERVRSRVSAYVYGNILVLAAILATSPENIAHWTAVIFVVATTATTFLAHVVAHKSAKPSAAPTTKPCVCTSRKRPAMPCRS